MDECKNAETPVTKPKNPGHRFEKGNKFGKGRPQGGRNSVTVAIQELLDGEGEAITRKAIEAAKSGDSRAMRLVLERIVPPTKERPVNLSLPRVESPQDITVVIGGVLEAVADGSITPGKGHSLAGLLESQRKALETVALEARLAAVEQAIAGQKQAS